MKTLLKNGITFSRENYQVEPVHILVDGAEIKQVSNEEIEPTP